ncbi:hypothetical protein Tco_0116046 [Tanacetum coccineum]
MYKVLVSRTLSQSTSEFEGISNDTCDEPICDDSSTFDALNDHSEILSDSNDDGTLSDDDDFEDIEYVSLEEVNNEQEEKEFDLEDILQIQDVIPSLSPIKVELTNIVIEEVDTFLVLEDSIPPGIESNFDPGGGEIVVSQNVEDNDSFTFVIPTFLSFLTYQRAILFLLLSTGTEGQLFLTPDPDSSISSRVASHSGRMELS